MRTPKVELMWWEGCPSTERALAELCEALSDLGLASAKVDMREIRTDVDADQVGFKGSPTILIDGADLISGAAGEDADSGEPIGLHCRTYRRRDGRISPTPDPADLREALLRAAARARGS